MKWDLIATSEEGQETVLHSETGNESKFPDRWHWHTMKVNTKQFSENFILRINQNHGDQKCCQMGQIKLFKHPE